MKRGSILITGSGSLGLAFIKLLHGDYDVTVIEQNEWTVAELQKQFTDVNFILGDFSNWKFDDLPVDYIIHTAAYKHLPLGEENPNAFIDNNILNVRKLFAEAYKHDVGLLFISTDKAVEPCSLYGYTKAIGESLAKHYNFSIARCGNILDSSGSVIPVWETCIKNKQPILVTDERMVRYFIEDYDAANQMWDQFKAGKGLIIPKCTKIRLLDLLAEVLKRHGYESASEYEPGVQIIGMRDKEKLEEKLQWDFE